MTVLLLLICIILLVVFFIKWLKLKKFVKQLKPYYELMYNYDTSHKLKFAVISPVVAVRPRSEYTGFTAKCYFTDYEAAELEREKVIAMNEVHAAVKPTETQTQKLK